MQRDMGTVRQHVGGVATVVALSLMIHLGLAMGSALMAHTPSDLHDEVTMGIASPDSAEWGRAVLKLNGMF
jgi:hypothetical protein